MKDKINGLNVQTPRDCSQHPETAYQQGFAKAKSMAKALFDEAPKPKKKASLNTPTSTSGA